MSEQAKEVKVDVLSTDGLDEFFDVAGTAGTVEPPASGTARTHLEALEGQPGHSSVEATDITTYISTSSAAKLASVDSRTIRRWHDSGKVRGQFSKGKLLIAKEDVARLADENQILSGTAGTEDIRESGTSGTENHSASGASGASGANSEERPGHPGRSADMPAPVVAFGDFLDRIERLSRENGELRALLERERLETQQLRLLTTAQPRNFWERLTRFFNG